MNKSSALYESTKFSHVLGGSLYQPFRRPHLTGSTLELAQRGSCVSALVVWLPLLVLASLLTCQDVMAADTSSASATGGQPRIGLALSGGGAGGIVHVGVLKVSDEMHIPISCITGTSMGSIVSGAFAVGRSPAEIEQMVLATD